ERLSKGWHLAMYGFFKPEVTVGYAGKWKYHFFHCAAKKCQGLKGVHGVQRFQDSKDRTATSNLKSHAVNCFGQDAINAAFNSTQPKTCNTSIFAAFTHQGQRLVKISHHTHTKAESHNRPLRIVKDPQFEILMRAGRPTTYIPSPFTISQDIKTVFESSCQCIDKILKDHPGQIHFATDAWTSPNHRAFVAWTVHLHHEGHILTFLLDIIEVPELHTGEALAQAFHKML
ncbi:hypothetical protein L208DRAFT_1062766, partial [Tricholoma matsutake]